MLKEIRNKLQDCQDVVYKEFDIGEGSNTRITVVYTDGLVNVDLLNKFVITPIFRKNREWKQTGTEIHKDLLNRLFYDTVAGPEVREIDQVDQAITTIFSGDAVIHIAGQQTAIGVSVKGWPARGVSEPSTESVVRGPRDSFTETFRFNTALVRRRIKDSDLKLIQMEMGRRTKTAVGIFYIQDIALPELVNEVQERLHTVDIDGILESGYIEQLIEDNTLSPFPQMKATERPDEVVAALLEGRVAILVDNSPFALIMPITLNALYHSPEDFYDRFIIASLLRVMRIIASGIALVLPALYISISAYTPGILPTQLLMSMAAARQGVAFGVVVEALIMEFAFELLREASIRLPMAIGSTLGIVGGLVVGQAAVEANLVSPIMVIIVAITAIATFAVPTYSLSTGFRIMRFVLMALSGILGLYGLILGLLILLSHLVTLKSFHTPYLSPFVASNVSDLKDSFVRAPLYLMKTRPRGLSQNSVRLRNNRRKIEKIKRRGDNPNDPKQ